MKQLHLIGPAVLALMLASSADAAVIWTTPAGNLGSYSYDSGQSANGHFGDGVASLDGFTFAPTNFVAGANGASSPASKTDTASVIVHTVAPFWGATAEFVGDYSILGTGTVDATGTLTISDLDSANVFTMPFSVTNVPVSTTTNANGEFTGSVMLFPVILPGPSNAKIELSATLTATADGNSTALIQLKDVEIGLLLAPEPTSLAALSLLGTLFGRRVRR